MWVQALWQGEGRKVTLQFARKYKFITYLYTKVNSLVQTNLSVYMIDIGIRLKIRLCTM